MASHRGERTIGLLFSGGLDSAILLGALLEDGWRVQPLYVDSQLVWQADEQRAARRYLEAVASDRLAELVVLQLPLRDLYCDHWSISGKGVPGADTADEAVYLPGRNPLLLIKTRLWCQLHHVERLALGSLRSNPFADATDRFFAEFEAALDAATLGHVELVRPFSQLDKSAVMQRGRAYPLELTFSCLAPVRGLHCGKCNKCAERHNAFRQLGINDPTQYGQQTV